MEWKRWNRTDGNLIQKDEVFLLIVAFCILDMLYASATKEEEIFNFSAYPDLWKNKRLKWSEWKDIFLK